VIDTGMNTIVATVAVGSSPQEVAITPDGKHAYVTNELSNDVSVIDTATNTLETTILVGPNGTDPEGVAITPNGKHAYVANYGFNTVSVIDTATNTVGATIVVGPAGSFPFALAITPDGKHAYVANRDFNTVAVIDTASNTVVGTPIPVDKPLGDSDYPGWATCLCRERKQQQRRQCFSDRHGHQHGGDHGRGGRISLWRGHHAAAAGRPFPRLQRPAPDPLRSPSQHGCLHPSV